MRPFTPPPPSGDRLRGYAYRTAGPVQLYLGDARDVLAAMPDACVDCIVTSPPYWSLRDYGTGRWHGGDPTCEHPTAASRRTPDTRCPTCAAVWTDPQYGLETSLDDYVQHLTAVFDEARRVLTPTGTLWLNLADSYATGRATRAGGGLPAKNLNGVPWRVAFALQRSGWLLRNAIIWAKKNPMPESVRDRLSAGYELLFLLTRSPTYYFDLDPIRVPLARPDAADGSRVFGGARKGHTGGIDATARRRGSTYGGKYTADDTTVEPRAGRGNLQPLGHAHTAAHHGGRNPGDVWHIATRPYRGAHVAPFPLDLPLRAIAAGCPPAGLVLDPFSGAATTGLAALHLGRAYIGVDIAADFHDEALTRLTPYLPTDAGASPHNRGRAEPAGGLG